MMHGHEKSDSVVVAVKPANKAQEPTAEASAGASAAEPVERRAGTKGNADWQSTHWTQRQARVSKGLERITESICRHTPEVGAVCGKAARTVLCGGARGNSRPYRVRCCLLHGMSPVLAQGCGPLQCSIPSAIE
jgi:hypothetical protein